MSAPAFHVSKQTPYGKHLHLGLEPFGGTPGAYLLLRVDGGPIAYLAYTRNVVRAPEENREPMRKALAFIGESGYSRVLISYFVGSPLDLIFAPLSPQIMASYRNVHGRLDHLSFKAEGEPLTLSEVGYEDARLRAVYEEWASLGCDRMAAAAPELFFSIWRFDAYHDRQKPLLAFDARGAVAGGLVFWGEPSHYDPKTVLAFFCYPRSTQDCGRLDALFAAGYARIASLGFSHALACADAENAPLRRLHAKHGFVEVEGPAGQFLCRDFAPAASPA